ncbi:MAG TPA: S8 family peptidase [Oligoflexia bacterium]|nr:S8 family peptidase [Oligoflexia bacterium]HMP27702.1 S8 family peptidase [Oligoflexia bacterium]
MSLYIGRGFWGIELMIYHLLHFLLWSVKKITQLLVVACGLLIGVLAAEESGKRLVVEDSYIVSERESSSNLLFFSRQEDDSKVGNSERLGKNSKFQRVIARSRYLAVNENNQIFLTASGKRIKQYSRAEDRCPEIIASYKRQGKEVSCSPDYAVHLSKTPNDPKFAAMPALPQIQAPAAWDFVTGSSDLVVAVIDTGVDYNHPDLKDNIWINETELTGITGVDNDDNGYIGDIHGYNFSYNNGDPIDDNGHGTHVAGTIGAKGENGIGVVGINWNVKIMPLKFLDSFGSGALSDAVRALEYVAEMKRRGVNIVATNNSWGGGGFNQSLYDAIGGLNNLGVTFVAAAGNASSNNDQSPSYPASYNLPNVVSVAAVNVNDQLAGFSNYGGNSVHIAAPGVSILSTLPGGGYGTLSGTSMAAPHVTGALALLSSLVPSLSPAESIARLQQTADQIPNLAGKVLADSGRLNLFNLLTGSRGSTEKPPPPPRCSYSARKIPFERLPDGEHSLIGSSSNPVDEGGFATVGLPFGLNLYGSLSYSLSVSPNGLAYFNTPKGMDYRNSENLSLEAFGFWSDLISQVSYSSHSTFLTLHWRSEGYAKRGEVFDYWLKIDNHGLIQLFLDFRSGSLAKKIGRQSTIGLSGAKPGENLTYSYNQELPAQVGVEFVPNCQAISQPPPTNGNLRSLRVREAPNRFKSFGATKLLQVRARGDAARLTMKINGKNCPDYKDIYLRGGSYNKIVSLRQAHKISQVTFSDLLSGRRSSLRLNRFKALPKLTSREHRDICRATMRNL